MNGLDTITLQLADDDAAHNFIANKDPKGLLYQAVDSELARVSGDMADQAESRSYKYGGRLSSRAACFYATRQLAMQDGEQLEQNITFPIGMMNSAHFLIADREDITEIVRIIPEQLAKVIAAVAISRVRLN